MHVFFASDSLRKPKYRRRVSQKAEEFLEGSSSPILLKSSPRWRVLEILFQDTVRSYGVRVSRLQFVASRKRSDAACFPPPFLRFFSKAVRARKIVKNTVKL